MQEYESLKPQQNQRTFQQEYEIVNFFKNVVQLSSNQQMMEFNEFSKHFDIKDAILI